MDEGPRRSSRLVKFHSDPNFVYDKESVRCFPESGSSGESTNPAIDNSGKNSNTNICLNSIELPINANFIQENNIELSSRRRSQSQERKSTSEADDCNKVNKPVLKSSTRDDVLEFKDSIWSVSSAFCTDTSEMPTDDEVCDGSCTGCVQDSVCTFVTAGKSTNAEAGGEQGSDEASKSKGTTYEEAVDQLLEAVSSLRSEVRELRGCVEKQSERIEDQEEIIHQIRESGREESGSERSRVRSDRGKSKELRAEADKARSLKVVKDKISNDGMFSEEVPDDGADLKGIKKKLTRRQRDQCRQQVDRRMKEAGAVFPDDSFVTTDSSGNESASVKGRCRHSARQIKSGAKIKKRPVIKTVLYPHTIANEDDGEDITAENITLAKFFSCFSYIMLDCGIIESRGRAELLHAISTVLEYLHWPEARTFHNVIILKIEQGVLDWESDFSALADNFVDKKVRMSFKSKGSATGTGAAYRSGNAGKGYGKGFRGSSAGGYAGKSKGLHGAICWQYNYTSCTYGSSCKRWHICKTCAEAGKLGEQHKASSHEGSSSRSTAREPRS